MPLTEAINDDTALVAQAQDGNAEAFSELVRMHRRGVIDVVYRMCGDAGMAEDAAQEAFVRAWRHLGSYRPRSPFRNWLYRIATNTAIDWLRRQRPESELLETRATDAGFAPEASAVRGERRDAVRQAVISLPPASRAVLVLREYEGLSYAEIADALSIPMGTVMSRLNYARGLLRQTLAGFQEEA